MKRGIIIGSILTAALCLVFLASRKPAKQESAPNSDIQTQEETAPSTELTEEGTPESVTETGEEDTAADEEERAEAGSVIEDQRISVFEGMIGSQNIRISIYRKDNRLTASYVKQNEDENEIKLEGTINTETSSFQLNNEEKDISITGGIFPAAESGDLLEGSYTSPESATGFKFLVTLTYGVIASPETRYSMVTSSTSDEVEAFARNIKKYILEDNRAEFAGLISYPITVNIDGAGTAINTAEEFESNYDKIITAEFKDRMAAAYTKYLFTNYMGIMMENGAIWFSDVNGVDELKIISINNN